MRFSRRSYFAGIAGAVLLASVIYILFEPEVETNGDPWRKISMKIVNIVERGLIRLADSSSMIENYRVRRLFQTLRTSLYRTPDNMHVEVAQIAVNGRPALHHCPEGDVSKQSLPGIVFFHGGSWISGSAAQWLPLTTYLSNTSNAIVISIDYRLSPEYKFPTAFEDCLKATKTILMAPGQYGIAFGQIALAGDDVGGNLALAVAHNLSRDEEFDSTEMSAVKLVGMFYPALQSFDFNLPSYERYRSGPSHLHTEDIISGTSLIGAFRQLPADRCGMPEFNDGFRMARLQRGSLGSLGAFYLTYYAKTLRTLQHLFGRREPSLTSVMATSSHVSQELKESEFYQDIFRTELLPYSFQQWVAKDELEATPLANQTLEEEIKNLILDLRFSPMLLPNEDLDLLPYTYFIAPEVDPKRDDSFLAYARLIRSDEIRTEHVYYSTERHGFLLDVADNAEARLALDRFGEYFTKVLKASEDQEDVTVEINRMTSGEIDPEWINVRDLHDNTLDKN